MGVPDAAPARARAGQARACPGQCHTFQGHHGNALFIYEEHVGVQDAAVRCLPQSGIGNQSLVRFRKSRQHNVFHADRKMWLVIRYEHQQGLQTGVQDTGAQAVRSVAIVPRCRGGQRLLIGIGEFVDLPECRPVLKPQFGGAFVEPAARDPAVATGSGGFQVDVFGRPIHAGSLGSHVRQPARSRLLRWRPGGQGVPVLPAYDLDEVCAGFGQQQGVQEFKVGEGDGNIRPVERLEEHFDLPCERHDRTA